MGVEEGCFSWVIRVGLSVVRVARCCVAGCVGAEDIGRGCHE